MMFTTLGVGLVSMILSLSSVKLDVPLVLQEPELPTGCEAVSTVMLLGYYDFDIDKVEFVSKYVSYDYNKSDDMYENYFYGNPFSEFGSYCNPNVCCESISKYFSDLNYTKLSSHDLTGESLDYILNLVRLGNPVAIWGTIDYVKPNVNVNELNIEVYSPSHCIVITGYDSVHKDIYINDPLKGKVIMSYDTIKDIYEKRGKMGLVIY